MKCESPRAQFRRRQWNKEIEGWLKSGKWAKMLGFGGTQRIGVTLQQQAHLLPTAHIRSDAPKQVSSFIWELGDLLMLLTSMWTDFFSKHRQALILLHHYWALVGALGMGGGVAVWGVRSKLAWIYLYLSFLAMILLGPFFSFILVALTCDFFFFPN